MIYRTLGKTGLNVSILSFGASSLGGVFRDVAEAEAIRTVHTAVDLGINFIDVSPYYGLTKAECVLGKALREIPRHKYFLATKAGRYGNSEFDFSAGRVKASVDESLRRMGVDFIDLIQCHDIEFGDLDQVVNETVPALREVQKAGKVGAVGITGLPLPIFEYVASRVEVDSILSYCRYSLNDTALQEVMPYVESQHLGIISASPLSMGLLTRRGAPSWHPAGPAIKAACARAAEHCAARGSDIAKLALQFSLANPRIHTTLVGSANPANMENSVRWMEEPIDTQLLAEVRDILAPIHNQTW